MQAGMDEVRSVSRQGRGSRQGGWQACVITWRKPSGAAFHISP